jgi:hypothetical protein
MKTLYDRLYPKLKKNLRANAKQYNSVNEYIIPLLKSKNRYDELTMSEISSVITWTEPDTFRWSYYDLKYGDLLFRKDA